MCVVRGHSNSCCLEGCIEIVAGISLYRNESRFVDLSIALAGFISTRRQVVEDDGVRLLLGAQATEAKRLGGLVGQEMSISSW